MSERRCPLCGDKLPAADHPELLLAANVVGCPRSRQERLVLAETEREPVAVPAP